MARTATRGPLDDLTPKQREVLQLIARGRSNPEIATALGVTIDGAKWHVREILSKLGVSSREEAAAIYRAETRPAARLGAAFAGLLAGRTVLAVAAVLAGAGLAAAAITLALLGRGDDASPPASPSEPAATASPLPSPPPGATDIPEVNAIIADILAGDVAAVEARLQTFLEPCAADPQGVGSPPRCPDGVADGTAIETFRYLACERGYPGQQQDETLRRALEGPLELFAVYRSPAQPRFPVLPDSAYSVVFRDGAGNGRLWLTDGDRIVGLWASCGPDVFAMVEGVPPGDFIMGPMATRPTPTPTSTPSAEGYPRGRETGVAEVDLVLRAVYSENPDRIRAHFEVVQVPCGTEPPCPSGVADATPIEAFPLLLAGGLAWVAGDDLAENTRRLSSPVLLLYAVFQQDPDPASHGRFPRARYVVVLNDTATGRGVELQVQEGMILGIWWSLGTATDLVMGTDPAAFVLPPPR
jgi:DNA-binding CsgD family transcriptional regulator